MKPMSPKDVLAALLCSALWGTNFAIIKIALSQIPPLFFSGLRLGLVGILLMGWVKIPRQHFLALFLMSITLYSLNFGLMMIGLHEIDAGLAAIITELEVPFSAILAALFLKDRMQGLQILGLVIAFIGAYFVCNTPAVTGNITPILFIIGATCSYAFSNIQIKWLPKIDALTIVVYASLFAAPQLLLASAMLEENQLSALTTIDFQTGLACIYTCTMATLSFFIWTRLIKIYSVNQIIPFGLLIPLFGVLSGILLLDEEITLKIIFGGIITIAGVWLVLYKPKTAPSGIAIEST